MWWSPDSSPFPHWGLCFTLRLPHQGTSWTGTEARYWFSKPSGHPFSIWSRHRALSTGSNVLDNITLSSVCCDAQGWNTLLYPSSKQPSFYSLHYFLPLLPSYLFSSCAILGAMRYFLQLQRSVGELWSFRQKLFSRMSDCMLRSPNACHIKISKMPFLKKKNLPKKRQVVKIFQWPLSPWKCYSGIKLGVSSSRCENEYCEMMHFKQECCSMAVWQRCS